MQRLAALMLGLAAASPAPAAVRTLFVGINHYSYSNGKQGNLDEDFHDLSGPVNDVMAMRAVLAGPRWKLDLGAFDPACPVPGRTPPPSITLTDACATRAAIVRALTAQITAAKPGDTLLFFYSGHGSQAKDRLRLQPDGKNSTIVPADSRGGTVNDILDTDLDRLIAAANARGVNVVTLFDSCHSGTATRDLRGGVARAAPAEGIAGPGDDIKPPPPLRGVTPGYRVHLSASADRQVSIELPDKDGSYHGVFTQALKAALGELDAPAYADVAAAVRRTLVSQGSAQTPGIDGASGALFLGASGVRARIFPAEAAGPQTVRVNEGTLAGITPGSGYAVYADAGSAALAGPPLTNGTVTSAGPGDATIALATALDTAKMPNLTVRETDHVYGGGKLSVRIDGSPAERARAATALAPVTDIAIDDGPPAYVFTFAPAGVTLSDAADGHLIGKPLPVDDALDAALAARGRALAKHFALLALAHSGAQDGAIVLTLACADENTHPPLALTPTGEAIAEAGEVVTVAMLNNAASPRFAYLFGVGGDLRIWLLSSQPTPLKPSGELDFRLSVSGAGRDHLLLLLTDRAVAAQALQQDGVPRDVPSVDDQLERLLRAARAGRSPREITPVTAWGAVAVPINIVPAKGAPPCAPPSRRSS